MQVADQSTLVILIIHKQKWDHQQVNGEPPVPPESKLTYILELLLMRTL